MTTTPPTDHVTAPPLVIIQAKLQYLSSASPGEGAVYHASAAGTVKEASHEGEFESKMVPVNAVTVDNHGLSLEREGFVFCDHVSQVKNFYNEDEINSVYKAETEELVKRMTGASEVYIFDHTRRTSGSSERQKYQSREPSSVIHNDYTEWSANKRLKELLGETKHQHASNHPWGIVNVWRPIETVENHPLALCNAQSVDFDKDIVGVPRVSPDGRKGEIQMAMYNPNHEWMYCPRMTRNQVCIFTTFHSLHPKSRCVIHTSFEDPTVTVAPARQSIETRCFIIY
jgi:hypothetical protein